MRRVEEASTIPLFGGRRAVWVKAGSRNIAAAVEALIAAPSDCRVVIEAGDLKRNAPLRVVCERAKTAAAICCASFCMACMACNCCCMDCLAWDICWEDCWDWEFC